MDFRRSARGSEDRHIMGMGGSAGPTPGRRTLVEAAYSAADPGHATPVPSEGLGGGEPDLTLNPDNDGDRNTLTEIGQATAGRNPQIDGRPVDPANREHGWGQSYPNENCHGVIPFKNIVPEPDERQRIADLHDNATPGLDQFGLCVPFRGALAYQCVEFVTRYYRDALGHGGLGGGNANTFLQGPRGGLEVHRFPTPTRPQAGDLMVEEGGPSPVGHVGIVESVAGTEWPGLVTVMQQNRGVSTSKTTFDVTITPAGLFDQNRSWSGFRRKGGVTPVASRGGAQESAWIGGVADRGEGNYFVAPGRTAYLADIANIYGTTVEDLRRRNPCIGNWVSAADVRVEIHVTDEYQFVAPPIGTATITGSGATIRSGPSATAVAVNGNHWLEYGRSVEVYDDEVEGSDDPPEGYTTNIWYKIAMYTGEDAYVFKELCSPLPT